MNGAHEVSVRRIGALLERGVCSPAAFRAALLEVPPRDRDVWVDRVLGLGDVPDDGPELPPGCTPYLPAGVDALIQLVDAAPVLATDTFVDLGSGVGRAAAVVQLLTGAAAVGIEVQSALVDVAEALATRLPNTRLSWLRGDAAEVIGSVSDGSVYFLYSPFDAQRVDRVLAALEPQARARELRVCCVNLPRLSCSWLTLEHSLPGDLAIYRSEGGPYPQAPLVRPAPHE